MKRTFSKYLNFLVNTGKWSNLSKATSKVLVVIDNHCDSKWECYPGVRTIARIAGVSKSATEEAIKELERCGLLIITPRKRKDHPNENDNNLYRLVTPPDDEVNDLINQGSENEEGGVPIAGTPCTDNRDTVYRLQGEGVPVAGTEQIQLTNPVNKQTPLPPEGGLPWMEEIPKIPDPVNFKPSTAKDSLDSRFMEFWKAYPNQHRVGKKLVLKIWQRLKVDSELLGKMLLALETQKQSKNGEMVSYQTRRLGSTRAGGMMRLNQPSPRTLYPPTNCDGPVFFLHGHQNLPRNNGQHWDYHQNK